MANAYKKRLVLLAEDVPLIRHGIRSVLHLAEDMEIVGEADDVEGLLRLTRDLAPNVVLIDQDLPGDSLGAIRKIRQTHPAAQIIVMTDQLDDEKVRKVVEAGAKGYILKDIPGVNLATAIRAVCNGKGYPYASIAHAVKDRLSHLVHLRGRDHAKTSGLTVRELDILMEVARGRTDDEIAEELAVTPGTIKTHIRHILRKLPARNRAQAVAYVLRKGLIE